MRTGGRLQAAIEVLEAVGAQHRPIANALADWGRSHRFAGSGDRNAVANLAYDALRRRNSIAWRMDSDVPRALVLGVFVIFWGNDVETLRQAIVDDPHSPEHLSDAEEQALAGGNLDDAPDWVSGDYPEWLHPAFADAFDNEAASEGRALAERAPTDLRVNLLKADREKALKQLSRFAAAETAHSPVGMRIAAASAAGRVPNVRSEAGYRKGWFEIQDEGSQIAALAAGSTPGQQVVDLCAGAGGKTLALGAFMENKGQVHAYDADRHRLAKIHERLRRAGARNVQVLGAGDTNALEALKGRADVVFVDAPCTGTGTWRRRPDAKWRLSAEALEARHLEQQTVLDLAAPLVRPGGRLVYVTCSVLPSENEEQVAAFLGRNDGFGKYDLGSFASGIGLPAGAVRDGALRLSPASTATDGLHISVLERAATEIATGIP